jgi:hypothetical protein
MSKTLDFYKGHSYSAFTVKLPKGYSLDIRVAEHQSGKVSVHQSVSKTIGFFNLRKMTIESPWRDPFDTKMMDKLNKILRREATV